MGGEARLETFLHQTVGSPELGGEVPFSTRPSWVHHDGHDHVGFDLPCEPL